MADLSPAAQEILAAYENAPFDYDIGHLTACAAVLCAAAEQFFTDWDGMCCAEHLKAIAAELEGSNG
jgi:hypothetical protein